MSPPAALAQGLDIARWLPIYADGLREPEPLRQSAVMGFCEMVSAVSEAVSAAGGKGGLLSMDVVATAAALRNSLSHGSPDVVAAALLCLKVLLSSGPLVCRELATRNLLRGLLVAPSRLQHRREYVLVGYGPPRKVQLSTLVSCARLVRLMTSSFLFLISPSRTRFCSVALTVDKHIFYDSAISCSWVMF